LLTFSKIKTGSAARKQEKTERKARFGLTWKAQMTVGK
jgi:hypothetical protein